MSMTLRLKDYLKLQTGRESASVSMDTLLLPFGLSFQGEPSDDLMLGLVLEELCCEFSNNDFIDPIDVASSALGLGYNQASNFLDEAPLLIVRATQDLAM